VFPASTDEVRAVVQVAAEAGVPVVAWGGGTAAAVGTPAARAGLVLGLRRMARLLEHEPGDLTVTVEAGMPVGELQRALRARGQWLSLDPPDAERATIGGVVAADASGPRRHLYGTVRDLLIGVTVVTADGAIVRGGGKVVKNVAGYDLPKLFVGSYGTLGVIAAATLKLRPVPDVERLVAVPFDRLKDAGLAVRAVMASDLIPCALELADGEVARGLGIASAVDAARPALIVGFDGLAEQVDWQCAELARLTVPLGGGAVETLGDDAWSRLGAAVRLASGTPAAVMKLAVLPATVADTMEQGASAARQRGLTSAWVAHAGVGVARAALFAPAARHEIGPIAEVLRDWRSMARAVGGHGTLESAPLAVKAEVPVWDDLGAAARIMQRIKAQLDPHDLLNPGRFVAGI
jgi:glycolate oxidase FAD binding subunit